MEGKCRSEDIIYKCIVTAKGHPQKAYLGTVEGDFEQRYHNHRKSPRNRKHANDTSLSKYIREMKDKHNAIPTLIWCIVKSIPGYSNFLKRCMLCLHQKYEILNYPNQEELLNKRSEIVSKCQNVNNFSCLIINQTISVLVS